MNYEGKKTRIDIDYQDFSRSCTVKTLNYTDSNFNFCVNLSRKEVKGIRLRNCKFDKTSTNLELTSSKVKLCFIQECEFMNEFLFESVDVETHASFRKTSFKGEVSYFDSVFKQTVSFSDTIFYDYVDFSGVIFNEAADFSGVEFQKGVNFSNTIFKKGVDFSRVFFIGDKEKPKDIKFFTTKFEGIANFFNSNFEQAINFENCLFESVLNFSHSNFKGNVLFTYSTFKDAIDFSETGFKKGLDLSLSLIYGELKLFKVKLKGFETGTGSKSKNYISAERKRETFRILKNALIQSNNRIDSMKFHKLEMQAYNSELWENNGVFNRFYIHYIDEYKATINYAGRGKVGDIIINELNSLSNSNGLNWFRGVIFTLLSGLLFFSLAICHLSEYPDYLSFKHFFQFINPTHKVDIMAEYKPKNWFYAFDFVGRIFVAYGIYQTVSAFRKFSKK